VLAVHTENHLKTKVFLYGFISFPQERGTTQNAPEWSISHLCFFRLRILLTKENQKAKERKKKSDIFGKVNFQHCCDLKFLGVFFITFLCPKIYLNVFY
jgi:hypothetical protein